MKTQLKLISCFAVMAIGCAGLYFSVSVRAQTAPQPTEDPYANKKENPTAPAATPTPTVAPRR